MRQRVPTFGLCPLLPFGFHLVSIWFFQIVFTTLILSGVTFLEKPALTTVFKATPLTAPVFLSPFLPHPLPKTHIPITHTI